MGVEVDSYEKRSAFQAVYLITFILASLGLVGALVSGVESWAAEFIKPGTDNQFFFSWTTRILLFVILLHWLRLYITLEKLEDNLLSPHPTWFKGWPRPIRFWEFVSRCSIVAWMGLKVITVGDIGKLTAFFSFLCGLYGLMMLWGVVWLFGEWRSTEWTKPEGWLAMFKFLAIDSFLLLSLPATAIFFWLTKSIGSTNTENWFWLALLILFAAAAMSVHLIIDACRRDSTPTDKGCGSRPHTRCYEYLLWIKDRIAGDEASFCLFFLIGLAVVRLLLADSGVSNTMAFYLSSLGMPAQRFAKSFAGVALVVLTCSFATSLHTFFFVNKSLAAGLSCLSVLVSLVVSSYVFYDQDVNSLSLGGVNLWVFLLVAFLLALVSLILPQSPRTQPSGSRQSTQKGAS